jgi:hypothetical protein
MPQNHSPLPWKLGKQPQYTDCIYSPDERIVAVCGDDENVYISGLDKVNAEFIVQAANSYHDLLKACKLALDEAPWQPPGEDIRTVLRTAIAKAEAKV